MIRILAALTVAAILSGCGDKPCKQVFQINDVVTHKTFGKTVVWSKGWGEDDGYCVVRASFPGIKRTWFRVQEFVEFQDKV